MDHTWSWENNLLHSTAHLFVVWKRGCQGSVSATTRNNFNMLCWGYPSTSYLIKIVCWCVDVHLYRKLYLLNDDVLYFSFGGLDQNPAIKNLFVDMKKKMFVKSLPSIIELWFKMSKCSLKGCIVICYSFFVTTGTCMYLIPLPYSVLLNVL